MQHQYDRADHDANADPDAGQDHQIGSRIGVRIAPKMPMPSTVLLTELDDGTLVLQGRPDGPRVRLSPDLAVPLQRALTSAFDTPDLTPSSDQGEAP